MNEQILSAGVYAYENDQSYVNRGTTSTGLALVGPTEKGPAYVPTDITTYSQYATVFGTDTAGSYLPQTAYSYLQVGNNVKVTRILGNGGYLFSSARPLMAITDGNNKILSVIYPTKNTTATVGISTGSTVVGPLSGSFGLNLSAATGTGTLSLVASASLNPTATNYLPKVIGGNEGFVTGSAFAYMTFGNHYTASFLSTSSVELASSGLFFTTAECKFTSSNAEGYEHASTPWVVSDGGVNLFKFHHISDGFKSNRDVKVGILNIVKGANDTEYSTFDVVIRAWNDSDRTPSYIEQFNKVTLDPNSTSYIAKVIGDKYSVYDASAARVMEYGDYANASAYVRIEVDSKVSEGSLHPQVYPNGHAALFEPIAGFGSNRLPAAVMLTSNSSSYVYSGFDYNNTDNTNYLNPIPSGSVIGNNVAFTKASDENKFILPFQGGNDGMNYTVIKNKGADITSSNLFGYNLNSSTSAGSVSYIKALNVLSNADHYSFDVLAMPGVIERLHPSVTDAAQTVVENRTDAVYLRDLTALNDTVATAISTVSSLDTSYSATYYPWVKVKDMATSKEIYVPPSVIVPQAYAYNDKVSAEWFAPAGLNRGGLTGAIDTRLRLTKADRDALYQARINPIAKFQTTGVVIWGQKTLQVKDSALNRINVRRLLINLRTYISQVANNYVFENNTTATRNKLIAAITPYMESVQTRQGLYAFRIDISDTLNTSDVIDRNQLIGKIYVSPVKSIEFILLEFNIGATGVSFG